MSSEQLSPEAFIKGIEQSAAELTLKERMRLLQHAKAWATVHYDGKIPGAIEYRIERMERRWAC